MADYLPVNSDASAITLTASGAVTGGSLVKASTAAGYCIMTNATTDRAIGVAAHDAPDAGRVSVYPLSGFVHSVPVMNAVVATSGNPVICSTTSGRADTHTVLASCPTAFGIYINTTTGTADGKALGKFVGF